MKSVNRELDPRQYEDLSTPAEKLDFLIKIAALSPSSHNTQPWLFRLSGQGIEVVANPERKLPGSDVQNREFFISLGTAIGALCVAAESYGLKYRFEQCAPEQFPIVARFAFDELTAHNVRYDVLQAMVSRHTNRYPFSEQALPQEFVSYATGLGRDGVTVEYIPDESRKLAIAQIVGDSIEAAFKSKSFTDELSLWIRPSLVRYKDGMPGYNIAVPWFLSLFMPWMIRHLPMSKQQRAMNEPLLRHAAAFMVITAHDDSQASWLRVGQVFYRIAVEAERQGIKIGVQAAPIEIGDFHTALARAIPTSDRPQMFFRLGYVDKRPTPSPRFSAKELTVR